MSMKSAVPINVDQSSTNDVEPINTPEAGGDTSCGDSMLNANKMERNDFQSHSIGADPVLESSKLLRKLSEAFGMSISL
ncbi:unnamed protein product [Wuchereria bancrofti]|uniref:Uncharacterized protein n=1 Tax=Wuchereria bancrofti TaxID=6293 RepID=A0A3P7F3K9_WUCBA|nr:unnamed protein product [Wuchereria bancrofti]